MTADSSVICPLCDGPSSGPCFPFESSWQGKTFVFQRCRDCGCSFLSPMPTEEELLAIYSWANYHAVHYSVVDTGKYARSLSVLERLAPAGGRVLDFGCGNGSFLVAAREQGFAVMGVELSPSAIDGAIELAGVTVMSLAEAEQADISVDAIHLHDVFAHLVEPVEICERLLQRLSPNGVLVIAGPLEDNIGLVHAVSSTGRTLRRRLFSLSTPERPPTMVVRLTASAHRRFFSERLDLRELHFEVYETGWPYLPARSRRGSSPSTRGGQRGALLPTVTKRAVGAAAIPLAAALRAMGAQAGNRCVAVYTRASAG
jgi:2-polyprenyl-3-methyl-5-hydroxy-6-metoxy-1,4-benzoquinol methylase